MVFDFDFWWKVLEGYLLNARAVLLKKFYICCSDDFLGIYVLLKDDWLMKDPDIYC